MLWLTGVPTDLFEKVVTFRDQQGSQPDLLEKIKTFRDSLHIWPSFLRKLQHFVTHGGPIWPSLVHPVMHQIVLTHYNSIGYTQDLTCRHLCLYALRLSNWLLLTKQSGAHLSSWEADNVEHATVKSTSLGTKPNNWNSIRIFLAIYEGRNLHWDTKKS